MAEVTSTPAISVVVPAYNEPPESLRALHDSLCSQSLEDFEVIVVDDCSSAPDYRCLTDPRFRVVTKESNSGPAASRNRGAREARAAYLFFTDADCRLTTDTLAQAARVLARESIAMGNTLVDATTLRGRAIGLLGFPGGGLIGFHNVWSVDDDGYTTSISSCNLAIRKEVFGDVGGFDETFPVAAGEDTMLARTVRDHGYRIRYVAEQVVHHEERSSLRGFVRWQITRGRGVYHVRRRVGSIGSYARKRLVSFGHSLRRSGPLLAPGVAALIGLSLVCQWLGYRREARNARRRH